MLFSSCLKTIAGLYLLFSKASNASVAQWQSTGFVNQRLRVQVPPLALVGVVVR